MVTVDSCGILHVGSELNVKVLYKDLILRVPFKGSMCFYTE